MIARDTDSPFLSRRVRKPQRQQQTRRRQDSHRGQQSFVLHEGETVIYRAKTPKRLRVQLEGPRGGRWYGGR